MRNVQSAAAVFAFFLLAVMLVGSPPAVAIVNQVDGTVVPVTTRLQACLDQHDTPAGSLDAIYDADIQPEIYYPPAGVDIDFVMVAEGGGYRNAFGWYNVGDDITDTSNLHTIFACRPDGLGPCDCPCGSSRWRYATIDFSTDPDYAGGAIGFWLRTPELLAGGGGGCASATNNAQRIYFTEKILNDDGDYVHYLVYTSATHTNRFYFGFEDLFRGGDNDFEDSLVYVEGLVPDCIPRTETCNNADDDCDTVVDDGLTRPCSTACGSGEEECVAGAWVNCDAPVPGTETCNGIDDNCNGSIDEGLTQTCSTICGTGTEYCVLGAWVDCDARTPTTEVCNGIDDDCDTDTDEGNPGGGATCGTDVGVCEFGTEQCLGGAIVCAGGVSPGAEICDGLDNDCNGTPDDGDPGGGVPCGTDEGECVAGIVHCIGASLQCVGEVPPAPEVCDGLDNDCDADVDEDDPGGGASCGIDVGECSSGIVHCLGGSLVCSGGALPTAELCDGLDNDCDGTLDNGNPGGGAACGPVSLDGVGICEAGVTQCVTVGPGDASLDCIGAVFPTTEECNGLDDDCNTLVDDGIVGGADCGDDTGECEAGHLECVSGAWVCVGEVPPEEEVCDGLDNDCDGDADEGNPGGGLICGTDIGECEPGITYCDTDLVPPMLVCLGEVGPTDEICDGLDNDCNHLVDDGLPIGEECGTDVGECEPGNWVCIDGELVCSYGVGPTEEVCDGLDNDCDGFADNEAECPGESICVEGYCASPCDPLDEWPCPSGRVCAEVEGYDGTYCIGDPCEDVVCDEGERCHGGTCVDLCDLTSCPPGQVCVVEGDTAICVPADCYAEGYECDEGERCEAGECVDDPCWEVVCASDEFCRDGTCHDVCGTDIECEDGFECHDGECVEDPCWGIECTGGYVCDPDTGLCDEDPCEDVVCREPLICVDGECVDDPCSWIDCPEGYACVGETCVDESLIPEPDPDGGPDGGTDADTGQLIAATGTGGCAGCSVATSRHDGAAAALAVLMGLIGIVIASGRRRTGARRRLPFLMGLAVLAIASWGCNTMPYCIGGDCEAEEDASTDTTDEGDASTDTSSEMDAIEDSVEEADAPDLPDSCNPLAEELCNGFDDDCDTLIDEDFDLDNDPNNCGACGNRCDIPHAYPRCNAGVCEIDPERGCDVNYLDCVADVETEPETLGCETYCIRTRDDDTYCDGYDNDCDCSIDEDIDFTTDVDNCGVCGVRCRFTNGIPGCESPTGLPEDAECVLADCEEGYHDIDLDPDTGCEYECSPCERTEGACELGLTCCTAGGDETCNGLDDDCDGDTDEGDPGSGAACGPDTGECTAGVEHCVGGVIECVGAVGPEVEICNGLDDDCDGDSDEPDAGETLLSDEGQLCGESMGDCELGLTVCVSGVLECQGGVDPTSEICDGHDNDCNGSIDDGTLPGMGGACGTADGECAQGVLTCVGGVPVCVGEVGPTSEVCNGLDDDCDTVPDNDIPGEGDVCGTDDGICSTGILQCNSGVLECAGEVPPTVEQCNGLDDDCDTVPDDGDPGGGGACGTSVGECSTGTLTCSSGSLVCTGEVPPSPEICDGLDNDCDGTADEGNPGGGVRCGTNIGECEYGTTVCSGGALQCPDDVEPTAEICDGLDNDCDLFVDNSPTAPGFSCDPDGVCASVTPTCLGASGWQCVYGSDYQTTETICDLMDNDCDGTPDEGCPSLATGDVWIDGGDTANSISQCMATDGGLAVHVAWLDRRGGDADIYYRSSTDGGVTWMSSVMRIDQGGGDNAVSPVIAAGYTDQVTAAWADFRGHTDYRDVYSRTSADAGSTWAGTDQRLDTGLDTDSLAVDVAMNASGVVVVVFETSAGGSDRSRSVYAVRSTDGGANFGAPVVVDHNTGSGDRISSDPHVGVDASGNAHVVWRDNRGGDGDIYYNCWSSGSWLGSDIRVDAGSGYSDNPRIAVSASGNVYIVWEDDRNGAVDVYAASTTGCSGSWSPSEVRLDTDVYANDSLHPTVASNGSSAWVVWEDYRDGLPDIRMSMTNSGGASWSALDFRINANDAGVSGSRMPDVDAVSGWVFVVWEDDRNDDVDGYMDGDRDIYLNYSLDAGLNFQPMDFLVNDDPTLEYDAQEPRAAAVTDRLHITWLDFRNSPYYNADVYYRVLLLP